MAAVLNLKDRVGSAERLWSEGDSAAAHEAFQDLFREIVLGHGAVANFGENEFLVAQRYADLAAETGHAGDALDLYQALQQKAGDPETRASAGFKRLHLAVEAGEAFVALSAYSSIWRDVGVAEPPLNASERDLTAWERGIGWREADRAALFSIACLALGRLHNAARRLPESYAWLKLGLRYAEGANSRLARLSAIPLRLALANSYLAGGTPDLCQESLDGAVTAIKAESLGAVYGIWLGHAKAKFALFQGRYGDVLELLEETRKAAGQRGMHRAVRAALVAEAEVMILLNQLEEAGVLLREAGDLAKQAGDVETLEKVARASFLQAARSRMFERSDDGSAAKLMPLTEPNRDDIVWTGDCLRDYERRETPIYAAIESAPSEAGDDLRDLWHDFENVESRLIHARLHSLTGLLFLRQGDSARAADHLGKARSAFREIGAERELYQTTAYLIFAVEKSGPELYSRLIEENDLRLARFECNLTAEQRNAFRVNKYTATEQKLREDVEAVLLLKDQAGKASRRQRPACYLRYWTRLHRLLRSLDQERQQRHKGGDARPAAPKESGAWGMLRRIVLHPGRNVTIGYLVLPDQTFLYSLRRWRMDCESLGLGRAQINRLVLNLRQCLFSVEREDTGPFDDLAQQISKDLGVEAIVDSQPRRVTHLTIVPDDELRRLPFCALRRNRKDGTAAYLIEDFTLNIDEVTARVSRPASASSKGVAGYAERNLKDAEGAAHLASDCLRRDWKLDCPATDEKQVFLKGIRGSAVIFYFGHGYFMPLTRIASASNFVVPKASTYFPWPISIMSISVTSIKP